MQIQKAKPGYKLVKSLFGKYEEIPEEWEKHTLIELCSGKPEYGANVSAIEKNESLPRYIRITDLNDDGSLRTDEWKSIAEEDAEPYLLQDGDCLFARTGATVGKTYLYKKEDGKCAFAGYLIRFISNNKILNPNFLFYLTHSGEYWRWLTSIQSWGVQPNVNAEQYSKMPVLLPSIKEQQKIATILGTVDDTINKYDSIIETAKHLKTGLMQQLLTKGIGHTKFKKVKWLFGKEIEIPEEWEIEKLKEITHKIGDGIHSTPNYVDDSDFYFINGNNLVEGKVVFFDNTRNVSEEEFRKYKLDLNMDTVFLSINGTIGNVAFYNNEKIVLGKSVSYIICNEKLNQKFLFYVLQSEYLKKFFGREQTSTTIFNVSLATVRNSPILLPDIKEQQKIASLFDSVDSKISDLESKNTSLQSLKKGLMQKLLTGQIQV